MDDPSIDQQPIPLQKWAPAELPSFLTDGREIHGIDGPGEGERGGLDEPPPEVTVRFDPLCGCCAVQEGLVLVLRSGR